VLDVSGPSASREVGFFNAPRRLENLTVTGEFAYVKSGTVLQIIDLSAPANPRPVGSIGVGSLDFKKMAVAGDYAYLASGNGGMRVLDVSDPAHPQMVDTLANGGWVTDVAATDRHAYLLDGGKLEVLDVSNSTAPQPIDSLTIATTKPYATSMVIQEGYAYVNGDERLHVVDVSNPAQPQEISAIEVGVTRSLVVKGDYAYLTSGRGDVLRAVDVSDPKHPQRAGSFDPGGRVTGVAVGGGRAYVAGGDAGLYVVR
jgi:hypothetical protein